MCSQTLPHGSFDFAYFLYLNAVVKVLL